MYQTRHRTSDIILKLNPNIFYTPPREVAFKFPKTSLLQAPVPGDICFSNRLLFDLRHTRPAPGRERDTELRPRRRLATFASAHENTYAREERRRERDRKKSRLPYVNALQQDARGDGKKLTKYYSIRARARLAKKRALRVYFHIVKVAVGF